MSELLGIREAAERANVSYEQMRHMARRGEIESQVINGRMWVMPEAVDGWLLRQSIFDMGVAVFRSIPRVSRWTKPSDLAYESPLEYLEAVLDNLDTLRIKTIAASETRFYCEHPEEPWDSGDFAVTAWRHAKDECDSCDDERALFFACRGIMPMGRYQPAADSTSIKILLPR